MKEILSVLLVCLASTMIGYAQGIENPSGFYPLTTDTEDYSGNDLHAMLFGNATISEEGFGIGHDAISGLQLPNELLNGAEDFTINFEFKLNEIHLTSDDQLPVNTFLSGSRAGEPNAFLLSYHGTFQRLQVTVDNESYFVPDIQLEPDTWYSYVVVRENNFVRVYLDGAAVGPGQILGNTLSIAEGAFLAAQEQDCLGGCFLDYQSLDGNIRNLCFQGIANAQDGKIACEIATDLPETNPILGCDIAIRSNPSVGSELHLTGTTETAVRLTLYTIDGKKVLKRDRVIFPAHLSLPTLSGGLYLLVVDCAEGRQVLKIVLPENRA